MIVLYKGGLNMEQNNPMPNNNQEESMYVEVDKNKKYYLVGSTNKKDSILFRLYFLFTSF